MADLFGEDGVPLVAGNLPSLGIEGFDNALEIGRGGFSVVYRAHQVEFGRWVALKLITSSFDDRAKARFERERRTIGALTGHPNIVTVFSAGVNAYGLAYIVMEYLTGGSLADRLPDQPFEWREATELMIKVTSAVEAAHAIGVLHRDIKPENVFLSAQGEPKLGDFGIARLEGMGATSTGVVTASVAHAAPEIIEGGQPTVKADVYALGSTLYALINGWPAHVRSTDPSLVPVLARILSQPIRDLRPLGVSDGLWLTLERAMAKDPADRIASAAELEESLRAALTDVVSPVTPPLPPSPSIAAPTVPSPTPPAAPTPEPQTSTPSLGAPNPDLLAGGSGDGAATSLGAPNPDLVAQPVSQPAAHHGAPNPDVVQTAPPISAKKRRKARVVVPILVVFVVLAVVAVAAAVVVRRSRSPHDYSFNPPASAYVRSKSRPDPIPVGSEPAIYRPPGTTRYVLATSNGIYSSSDGVAFPLVEKTEYATVGAATGPNGWVVVGIGAIRTSADGISWKKSDDETTYNSVATDGRIWIAVGNERVARSDDGTKFVSLIDPDAKNLQAIATNGKGWVAVGQGGLIRTSLDGESWGTANSGVTVDLDVVATNGSQWLAFGDSNVVLVSSDGISWTPGTLPGDPPERIGGALFHEGWRAGGFYSWNSKDGVTWKRDASEPIGYRGMAWDGTNFVGVSLDSSFFIDKLDGNNYQRTTDSAGPGRGQKEYVVALAVAGPAK